MNRPNLDKHLDIKAFQEFYYLKEELEQFCRQESLQATGSKEELTKRIIHYLTTGEKLTNKPKAKTAIIKYTITEETLIEDNFVCTEKHRVFFKQKIGKGFSFIVAFQKWLKNNAGKNYNDAIKAYYQIKTEKKNNKTKIDKQFEYNTYIRDFFADNQGKALNDAIKCWRYKKKQQGSNKYEKNDLRVLQSKDSLTIIPKKDNI